MNIGKSSIDLNMIKELGTHKEYIDELIEITFKMLKIMDKEESEITDEDKQLLKRSSELILLLEVTEALEKIEEWKKR